ncbi:MAG: globin [Pseudomonadota bacterium]
MGEAMIETLLERVAETGEDPTARIYERLFAARPELEALFVLDTDGGVRGSMVQTCVECALDLAGPRTTAPFIIAAARTDHEGYGVEADVFDAFFAVMGEVFSDMLGAGWTPEFDAAWRGLTEDVAALR